MLRALAPARPPSRHKLTPGRDDSAIADEIAALNLVRQAEASQVGSGTVERLELVVDDLATAYPGTPAAVLLDRVRGYLGYVTRLLDAKTTLAEHRRLLVVGGWLSLLAATTLIDLHRDDAAAAHLRTAAQLARETEHAEIAGWCLETQAWQVLTAGDYRRAADISQAAQRIAPKSGSAFIQATAQEGRAWARLGDARQTRATPGPARPALVLTAAGKHDEAAGVALEAVRSGRLAPVDGRRAREIVLAVAERGVPEAAELAEAYRETCDEPAVRPYPDLLQTDIHSRAGDSSLHGS